MYFKGFFKFFYFSINSYFILSFSFDDEEDDDKTFIKVLKDFYRIKSFVKLQWLTKEIIPSGSLSSFEYLTNFFIPF